VIHSRDIFRASVRNDLTHLQQNTLELLKVCNGSRKKTRKFESYEQLKYKAM
jgi:hypothetical protein